MLHAFRSQAPAFEVRFVSLFDVLRGVVEEQLPLAEARQVGIGLSESPADIGVAGRADDLHALLRNLVDNAIRYSPAGGRVDMLVLGLCDGVVFEIVDQGPGIAAHERARVFDPFYRISGASTTQGSGLGLSIVRTVAERIGAAVELRDATTNAGAPGLRVSVRLRAGALVRAGEGRASSFTPVPFLP